ncbi:MAG: hypothetical protein COW01_13135 [Bdellovibrionales bacterium CG12_big_fil_rev_8_21_14_0_65_38_15]|nr:MAG: hypothetical protein COW79_06095 [Bdellovibrionales bacterium CG22_combo_CG10-13_8_21_14_all_38_13]PIQ53566.1 MAG: hypothetical protein COW01_13135 [Bdellovibrionales bacterium CG12_big_fil_rev_8_21_14_0_65_38_15]PIR28430.1 MAG: hypothetical protein COV38_15505 [Bdellovibrionales bacterium CG11_big_fil_rev_8_21_14_0_20_38_13]
MSINYLSPLIPHAVYKPWGGSRLAKLKGINESKNDEKLGETWEVSRLEEGLSLDQNKNSLSYFTQEELPYLVKFIDTQLPLSVQVHPHDKYAARYENSQGKTECWVILDSKEGAGIYLGFKPDVTEEDFFRDVASGADLTKYLQFHQVKAGDFFFVPAGSVHAIGADITLAEIQQSSGVTYRVWDWNRVDEQGRSRELHIEQAKAVLNFSPDGNSPEKFQLKNIFMTGEKEVINHPQFCVSYYNFSCSIDRVGIEQRVTSVMNLDKPIRIKNDDSEIQLAPYECCLVKNGSSLDIQGGKFLVIE